MSASKHSLYREEAGDHLAGVCRDPRSRVPGQCGAHEPRRQTEGSLTRLGKTTGFSSPTSHSSCSFGCERSATNHRGISSNRDSGLEKALLFPGRAALRRRHRNRHSPGTGSHAGIGPAAGLPSGSRSSGVNIPHLWSAPTWGTVFQFNWFPWKPEEGSRGFPRPR